MNGEAIWIDCPGGRLRIGDFCRLFKVPYRTVLGRIRRGEQTFEQLSRPPEPRFSKRARAKLQLESTCPINSLLAGWKSVPGASEQTTGPGPSVTSD